MKSWKSTIAGLVTAAAGFVLFSPEHFRQWPILIDLAKYVMLGGLAALGIVVKDASAHSTADEVSRSTAEETAKVIASLNKPLP